MSAGLGPSASTPATPTTPDDVPWRLSYDRASVDAYLAEVDLERTRLQTEINDGRARLDAIVRGAEARRSAAMAELGELVTTVQAEMATVEEEHQRIVATISDAAAIEAARVLAAAHREAEAMRLSTASLPTLHEPVSASALVDTGEGQPADGPDVDGHADAG